MQMRFIPILVLSCAAVSAQQSLTTTFANNNAGAAGGGVYFTLTAGASDVTVTDCDFNLGAGTGSIDIYTTPGTHAGNELNMALWTVAATAPVTSTGPGGTNGVLSVPLVILAGTSVGVAY
ncbi:MAG: putative outer membrane repeat protein, partial [Planctomycetota bacterium]